MLSDTIQKNDLVRDLRLKHASVEGQHGNLFFPYFANNSTASGILLTQIDYDRPRHACELPYWKSLMASAAITKVAFPFGLEFGASSPTAEHGSPKPSYLNVSSLMKA